MSAWKSINSLEVFEFRLNNVTYNCSESQLKETFVLLDARTRAKVEDLNQIQCSSAVENGAICSLPNP